MRTEKTIPGVPDHELLVIADTAEEGLVEEVPGHVLHHRRVASEYRLRVDDLVFLMSMKHFM